MKDQRHKRKESFSVLLISNIDRSSRQFQISMFTIQAIIGLLVVILAVLGWLGYQYATAHSREEALHQQLAAQEEKTAQLEQEKEAWDSERLALAAENEALRQAKEELKAAEEETQEEEEPEPAEDSTFPTHYPYQGSGVLGGTYSEEQPYISISTYAGGTIVAAGDGTVTAVGQDDTYDIILEITHSSGYTTRYLCRKEAELKVEEGAQVSAGDVLVDITTDDTQMDYQILKEGETVDPLAMIDAKG